MRHALARSILVFAACGVAVAASAATKGAGKATPKAAEVADSSTPEGEWLVKDHTARIAIAPCGTDLCGNLSWTNDGKDLGAPVLVDMKPDGARWTGTVIDVRDGSRYMAHISLKSPELLKLDGCVLHGLICKGEMWTRTKPVMRVVAKLPQGKQAAAGGAAVEHATAK